MAAPAQGDDSGESASDPNQTPKSPPSSFYGYLFKDDKSPTETLEVLLRALGKHIIAEIGDKNIDTLTTSKLAAFYKAVGGDYDALFVNVPFESISFVWQVTGCQHSLQPIEGNDFGPPSVPALTLRGFVRWESIEILLGPQEHVPFLQYAVKNWALKHPDTGVPFPTDLPRESFPTAPDPDVDRWHKGCAEKLRRQATPKVDHAHAAFRSSSQGDAARPSADPVEPKVKLPYSHVRNPFPDASPRYRGQTDYFARPVRVAPTQLPKVPPPQRVRLPVSPERKYRPGSSSDERRRRRSLSDYPSPPPPPPGENVRPSIHVQTDRPAGPQRRHSQPRHVSSSSSPSNSDPEISPRTSRRPRSGGGGDEARRPAASVRHIPVTSQSHPNLHPQHRAEDPRKRSLPFPVPEVIRDKFDKVASYVTSGRSPDRHRSSSGRRSDREREREREREMMRRSRDHAPGSRLRGSWEDVASDESDDSDASVQRRTREKLRRAEREARQKEEDRARDRDRERERDRGRDRGRARDERERDFERERERERDRERERERDQREREREMEDDLEMRAKRRDRERFLQRPEVHRRTSSHADIDRMREDGYDNREREFRDDKRRWKERATSPMTGVTGRRYPEPVWN